MSFSLLKFAHLRIPLRDILIATNNFDEENILEHGGDGKLYKGHLLVLHGKTKGIVARKLEGIYGHGEIELWTELSMLSECTHKNLVSIVGFCDEDGAKIIIYEHTGHGCLYQHLRNKTLTWPQRLQICLGVANALNSIHNKLIHGDINVSNIIIDDKWEAKVFGFGLSTKYPGNWGHRLLFSHYFDTSVNRDPVYKRSLCMTPKYDVYSFGVLLYDVLCGKEPMIRGYDEKDKLNEMIDPSLKEETDEDTLTRLSTTANDCLNQQWVQRPSMDQIVKVLQSGLKLQSEPKSLILDSAPANEAIPSNIVTTEKMERLKIPISVIRTATNNFHPEKELGKGGFGTVFEAELDYLDIKSRNVAIKHIDKIGKEGFLSEVKILASCDHPNIVSLLGYSNEDDEMVLVFELASKGALDDCLKNNTMANVTWAKRIQICLDVAQGLKYIHDKSEKRMILHRDIKSANILLDEKWNAKLADFGLSKINPEGKTLLSVIETRNIVGTPIYVDPVYVSTGIYGKASDVYSFGVVLLEMLAGKLAHHSIYNNEGIVNVAKLLFKEGTIKELIDPNMMEEVDERIFTVNKGPNQESLDAFTEIANRCLLETQEGRPKMEVVIKELQRALDFQGKSCVLMKYQLSDIKSATKNFSAKYCIGVSVYGMMYNARLDHIDSKSLFLEEGKSRDKPSETSNVVALKRIFKREDSHGKRGFFAEIDLLASFKHPNVVSLLGVSSERQEMILIYENAFKGSLHDCLGNIKKMAKLTWAKRVQIGLDIAHGLKYLRTCKDDKERIAMQFDMNSANILLDAKWKVKIACFWLSTLNPANKDARKVQLDPEYIKIEKLKKESDIYSFGVILYEILCGKVQYDEIYFAESAKEKGLPTIARQHYIDKTILNKMIDPNLKEKFEENTYKLVEEVNKDSLDAFLEIAHGCCAVIEADRPPMDDIINKLESALESQVKYMKQLKAKVMTATKDLTNLKNIPLKGIKLATNNFSQEYIIGRGGSSVIYKGDLGQFEGTDIELPKTHRTVVIKRMRSSEGTQGEDMFIAELKALSNCKHHNIVSLLHFCYEKGEMILILDYASKGSLGDFLEKLDKLTNFTWVQRLKVCIDIARGLDYLHTGMENGQQIIHRDIKSANILLNDSCDVAQIADFGLCKLINSYDRNNYVYASNIAGTDVYLDPEYKKTHVLRKESDIYSFGVVLFEIMCGKLAYDKEFGVGGLGTIARKYFEEETLKKIVDHRLTKKDKSNFILNGGLNQDSLDTFSTIAYKCLAETHGMRPKLQVVITELQKAYDLQINNVDRLRVPLENIQRMTENFSDHNFIGEGRYWKQYKGEMAHDNINIIGVAKRFDRKSNDEESHHFLKEREILCDFKHKNIIGIAGYCEDMDEQIIVYEKASNGRLDEHLDDTSVTWMQRLKIGVGIACGLQFLHAGGVKEDNPIMHRDIKSASILLDGDWTAKISNLEFSLESGNLEQTQLVNDNFYGSFAYVDPEWEQHHYLTTESDIYSLGVVLFEMLCGRLAWVEGCENHSQSLGSLSKEMVFKGMKGQIEPDSLNTFVDIALWCLKDKGAERPKAGEVVVQLKKAVEFQEDLDIWEAKLPRDYKEIFHLSEIIIEENKKKKKKDIYTKLTSEGLLLRDREVCLSLGNKGEKHYMISAKKLSYKHDWALNWRHIPDSRFENVAEMFTRSHLNITSKIRTWFLSSGVNYGVHLVFKFCGPHKISTKPMYVNLTYKMGSETFHAYFATCRDKEKEWMTIELCRFLNHEQDKSFEVLLESFSKFYCGKGAVYVEGLEFRAIDNVQQVINSNSGRVQVQQLPSHSEGTLTGSEESEAIEFSLNEVKPKKHLVLAAHEVLHYSFFYLRLSYDPRCRIQEGIELTSPKEVLRINTSINYPMMSEDTDYSCYLVFKLSEKCHGLHCPVRVRDLSRYKTKVVKNIYFRFPSPWNLHDVNDIPKQRDDGWMEVNVWNFKPKFHHIIFYLYLQLTSYEGTMAGLIVGGLEFRPM